MKTLAIALMLALVITGLASADEYVRGYVRRDGIYVPPHFRTSPDSNRYNNYSYPGNVNPYTGERAPGGYQTPYNNPQGPTKYP